MKHFVLTLAAMAVMGAQSATAQNKVVNLTAESTTMNVAAVTETEQTVQLSRYLFAGYNTLCLPASLTADELQQAVPGARVERLAAIGQEGTTLYLYFVDCTAEGTEAGMPYLIFSPTAKYMRVKGINAATMNEDITTVRMSDGQGNQLSFGSSWTTRQKDGLYGIPAKQNVQVLESILIRTTAEQAFRPTRCGFNWESQSATATSLEIKHVGSLAEVTAIKGVATGSDVVDVYDLKGNIVKKQVNASDATGTLPTGVYVVGGRKVTVK